MRLVVMQVSEDQIVRAALRDIALCNFAKRGLLPLEANAPRPRDRDNFVVEDDPVLAPRKKVAVLLELSADVLRVTGKQVVPNAPTLPARTSVNVADELSKARLLPAHRLDYHDPSSCRKHRLWAVAARVMVAMYWVRSAAICWKSSRSSKSSQTRCE